MIDVMDLIGKPYKIHGRDKNGFDCYGLVMEVEKRYGNILPDFDYVNYTSEYFVNRTTDVLKTGKPVKVEDFVEGAILLFEGTLGLKDHIGVYIGDGYYIHCNKFGVLMGRVSNLKGKKMEIFVWQN